jgi:hypothetical protein
MKSSFNAPLTPQLEENIQKAVWKSENEFPLLMENAYENIKILIENVK